MLRMLINVRVERIDRVVFGDGNEQVIGDAVHHHVRNLNRLGEHQAVQLKVRLQQAERRRFDALRSECRLLQVLAGTAPIVVIGENAGASIFCQPHGGSARGDIKSRSPGGRKRALSYRMVAQERDEESNEADDGGDEGLSPSGHREFE